MKTADTLKIALAGVSHVHMDDFIRVLNKRDDAKVVAVWDPDSKRAQTVAQRLGSASVDRNKMFQNGAVFDGMVIASQTSLHRALVPLAIRKTRGLFVEKPLGMDGAETAMLAEAIDASGILFHTGFFLRDLPAVQAFRKYAHEGKLGSLTDIHLSYSHPGLKKGWLKGTWLLNQYEAGGGAMLDLGLHCVDLMEFISGDAIDAVTASFAKVAGVYTTVDDHSAKATMTFRSTRLNGSFYVGWQDDPDQPARPNAKGARLVIEMKGTAGAAYFSDRESVIIMNEEMIQQNARQPDAGDGLTTFLNALSGIQESHVVSTTDALHASRVMDALYRAASIKFVAAVQPRRPFSAPHP